MMSLLASSVLTAAMAAGCGGCAPAPACQVVPAAPAGNVMPAAPAPAATAQATTGYRSYSYQPGTVAAPVYRSNASSRPFYSYPKTDPRRYQHN